MPYPYIASDWYWVVAESATEVWASARLEYVPVTDATYEAWLAAGNVPTNIGSVTELLGVMTQKLVPLLQLQGVAVNSTGTPALDGTYPIDAAAQSTMTALSAGIAAGKALPGGGTTFNYPDMGGTQHAFTAANFLNFAAAIEGYLYDFNQALPVLVSGGSASLPEPPLLIP